MQNKTILGSGNIDIIIIVAIIHIRVVDITIVMNSGGASVGTITTDIVSFKIK